MPDKDGNLLPPIDNFDGDKQSTKLEFQKCKHTMNFISPSEIKCIKCGVGYTGNTRDIFKLKKLLDK